MPILSTLNNHARDTRIKFDEGPHIYTFIDYPETPVTSVTTLVHQWIEPFDADKVLDRIFNTVPIKEKYKNHTRESLKAQWEQAGTVGSRLGTELHQNIEDFYNGQEITNTSIEWKYFKDFNEKTSHLKPYRTEWIVYDIGLQLAGSIDMVFEHPDGTISIYDWKRAKEIKKDNPVNRCMSHPSLEDIPDSNFWHYSFQLNIYKFIVEKNYGKKVKGLYLVQLHPDQKSFAVFPCADLSDRVKTVMDERLKTL